MTDTFKSLFEANQPTTTIKNGQIIKASILNIERDYVTLDAGLKSEGLIPLAEFTNAKGEVEIDVGDEVDVVIDNIEDGFGGNVLSRDKAKRQASWLPAYTTRLK